MPHHGMKSLPLLSPKKAEIAHKQWPSNLVELFRRRHPNTIAAAAIILIVILVALLLATICQNIRYDFGL